LCGYNGSLQRQRQRLCLQLLRVAFGHRELAFERDHLRPIDPRAGDVPERSLARGPDLFDRVQAWAAPTIRKRVDTARASNILRRHGTDDAGHGASTHY
jgi:hypothetical protein